MAHRKKTKTVRLPVSTINKLGALREWDGEPWYSIINRLIKENGSQKTNKTNVVIG